MRRLTAALATASILLLAATVAGKGSPWEKVAQTDDGIAVYMREVPETTVKEVKVRLRIPVPPRIVLDAACDPKSFKKSLKYVEKNRYYWVGDPDVWYTYQLVSYPVVDERDYVMRYERTLDPDKGVYRLTWNTTTDKGPPPSEDAIRVTLATGGIEVLPRDEGKASLLKFRLLADPGGNIPGWVINIANRWNLPDIIREIRDAAHKRHKQCQQGNCRHWDALGHDY